VNIPPEQVALHTASETAAVLLLGPFLLWLATRPGLSPFERNAALVAAVATFAVDGHLLARFRAQGA
jgi:hypothetical protein